MVIIRGPKEEKNVIERGINIEEEWNKRENKGME